jgi:hypothetical protein
MHLLIDGDDRTRGPYLSHGSGTQSHCENDCGKKLLHAAVIFRLAGFEDTESLYGSKGFGFF